MSDAYNQAARETLVAGLRNLHSLEKQAISTLEPQVERLEGYPDLQARIREHVEQSREHAKRVDIALRQIDASTSPVKDALLGIMGWAQSSWQGVAQDTVLKNTLANIMFEHFEIASYRSVLKLADLAGHPEIKPDLEQSLREEEEMAKWLEDRLNAVTERYVEHEAKENVAEASESEDKKKEASALDHSSSSSGSTTEAKTEGGVRPGPG